MAVEGRNICKEQKTWASVHLSVHEILPYDEIVVPHVEHGYKYLMRFVFVPLLAVEMHYKCFKFSCANFKHCKHRSFSGTIGLRYRLSLNRELVDLAHIRLF